ncbi:putative lipoprotein [Leptospira langatensis]|uniref:Lipoprotein n=1 Tax=Leptospira langatensis TaxID=2484983 RepID=A0A5F1ZVQ3_9LEPT|nr:putative lipoprotein [Leptospira langatensis]TGK00054.1 putative lipoprotein [Leptospira langatensis]TGL42688.1 putative lipoprotein [Leptospira langatensis]
MKYFQKILGVSLLLLGLVGFQNCFILDIITSTSQSISKSSDSLDSISKSVISVVSSVSSSSADKAAQKKVYQKEVETLTLFHLQNGPSSEFRSDLAEIAAKNGVVNWKSSEETYVSIGRGLRKAGISDEQFRNFAAPIASSRPVFAKALEKGYLSL